MWDHTAGCAKQYHCTYNIYLLSFLALECCVIIDAALGALDHGKDVFDGINFGDKWIIKLVMENILNPELFL